MIRPAPVRAIFLLLLLLVPVAAWPQSQATTGVIEGTVSDPSGAALPGVTVTMRNTSTNFQQQVITDSGGRFRGVLLPLGPYEVTAQIGAGRIGEVYRATNTHAAGPVVAVGSAVTIVVSSDRNRRRTAVAMSKGPARRRAQLAVERTHHRAGIAVAKLKFLPGRPRRSR